MEDPPSPKKRLNEPEYPGPVALGQPLSLFLPLCFCKGPRRRKISGGQQNKSPIVANFRPGQGYRPPAAMIF